MDYRNGHLYVALSACNAFHMHRMTYRSHREKKIRAACILGTEKKIDFLQWLYWRSGRGFTGSKWSKV